MVCGITAYVVWWYSVRCVAVQQMPEAVHTVLTAWLQRLRDEGHAATAEEEALRHVWAESFDAWVGAPSGTTTPTTGGTLVGTGTGGTRAGGTAASGGGEDVLYLRPVAGPLRSP